MPASAALQLLLERRDSDYAALQDFATPILEEKRDMTDEEEAKHVELRGAVTKMDDRIAQLAEDEAAATAHAEARSRILADVDMPTVKVNEARTYGPGSSHSWVADRIWGSDSQCPQNREALERLAAYGAEIAGEMRDSNSSEGKRAARVVKEQYRSGNTPQRALNEQVDRAKNFTREELRTGMDTTSGSGGSFVTPQYFVADYAPYRQFGRAFADQCYKQDLPEYGMTIYLPHVATAATVASQSSQNSAISETDPTAGYLSVALTTNAGQVTVSQQLLDRAGPNFAFDKMIFDQLQRAYNLTLDTYAWTQALANSVSVTSAFSAFTWQTFASKVAGAKAAILDTAGTVMPPTHVWAQPSSWEYATVQIDATAGSNRPGAVPTYAGPYNAWAAGEPANLPEGNTGYRLLGLPVYTDANMPQDGSSHNQAVVAAMDEVWLWEGDLVMRAVPQTYAQNLSVLLQVYAYVGEIVRYPAAVQTVSGAGLTASF
jgi:hypothetical protein